jgi:hypothetical protein
VLPYRASLNWKRRWAYEAAAGGAAFSGQGERDRPVSEFSLISAGERSHAWTHSGGVEFAAISLSCVGVVVMVQLTFSFGFRDSTAAAVLVLLLFAACCKTHKQSKPKKEEQGLETLPSS